MTEPTTVSAPDKVLAGATVAAEPNAAGRQDLATGSGIIQRVFIRSEAGVLITLLCTMAVVTAMTSRFLTGGNISSTTRSFSFVAMAAIGEGLIIISGGLDLSVGSVMGLGGLAGAWFGSHGYGTGVAILAGLACGVLVGFTNGILIAKFNLNPFIVTLAMLNMVRSLIDVITQGFPLVNLPTDFDYLGQGSLVGIPVPVIIMVAVGLIFAWVLRSTSFGWHVFALGGNAESALLSGVRVVRTRIVLYTLGGLLAGSGGLLLTAWLGVGDPTTGTGYELNVIASCIIGGVSLYGGIGTVFGMLLGAALIGVIQDALVLLGVSTNWQQFALGSVILLAVIVDHVRSVRTGKPRPAWLSRLLIRTALSPNLDGSDAPTSKTE